MLLCVSTSRVGGRLCERSVTLERLTVLGPTNRDSHHLLKAGFPRGCHERFGRREHPQTRDSRAGRRRRRWQQSHEDERALQATISRGVFAYHGGAEDNIARQNRRDRLHTANHAVHLRRSGTTGPRRVDDLGPSSGGTTTS